MKFNKLQTITENNTVEIHLKHMHKLSNNALFSIDHVKDNHYHILTRQQFFENERLMEYGKQHHLTYSFCMYDDKKIFIKTQLDNASLINFNESKMFGLFVESSCDGVQQLILKKIINKINESSNKNFHLDVDCKPQYKISGGFISEIYRACAKNDNVTTLTISTDFHVQEPQDFVIDLESLTFASGGPNINVYTSIPTTSIDKFSEILTKYQQTRNKNQFIDELIENGFEDLL